ncbi:MAG: hypothetical protein CVU79_07395 [Elusimicrobia bacterium HGW-Elusimicrobia-3]|nr:MAG: hypothetical protein CVU79_07395 [Elusimicrobia bacterium HGW-Elusimicrobia-3]
MIENIGIKRAALFLWHWVLTGFFLGTLTLMGPVRWATNYTRGAGWSALAEKLLVLSFIGALAAVSLLLARLLTLKTEAMPGRRRYALPALSLALFAAALLAWMNPKLMIDAGMKTSSDTYAGAEFVFGPYPEAARLAELKGEGYTGVISLLSRAVVPFEPMLLNTEISAAGKAGVELIHIPMLPWVSSNDHVKAKLEELLARGGRYYVHCYLGKDRVNVFRNMLVSMAGDARVSGAQPGSARSLRDITKFERGAITALATDVFFTPYPTDEEFFGYVLNGTVASLVSLLDPKNPEDLPWIRKEKKIAAEYGLKYANYPWRSLGRLEKEKAVREMTAFKKPLVVHAFLSRSPESSDFIATYKRVKQR